jgi:hypothetical protein
MRVDEFEVKAVWESGSIAFCNACSKHCGPACHCMFHKLRDTPYLFFAQPEVSGAESSATAAVLAATALSDEQRERLAQLYSELAAAYPRSSSCKRIQLDFLQVLCCMSAYIINRVGPYCIWNSVYVYTRRVNRIYTYIRINRMYSVYLKFRPSQNLVLGGSFCSSLRAV